MATIQMRLLIQMLVQILKYANGSVGAAVHVDAGDKD